MYNTLGDTMNFLINYTKELSSPHKHPNYEIIIYTKGNGVLHVSGKDIEVHPGKIIIIPPQTVHYSSKTGDDFERIYINGDFTQFFNMDTPTVILDNSENEGLLLAKILYNNRYSTPDYVASLVNAFTHFLLKNIKMESDIFLATKNITEEISNDFYNCNIDLSSILAKSGYAEDYIRAQFKKIMGKTPTEFLTQIRINHACYLIDVYRHSLSLAEIAEKCGYTDYVYFSRRFKQITKVSPRKYLEGN